MITLQAIKTSTGFPCGKLRTDASRSAQACSARIERASASVSSSAASALARASKRQRHHSTPSARQPGVRPLPGRPRFSLILCSANDSIEPIAHVGRRSLRSARRRLRKARSQGRSLERERLLGGNWKIRPAAGLYFKREWCAVVDQAPADLDVVRYWDLAATEKTELNDPDWIVGLKLGRDKKGGHWLLDTVRGRPNPGDVERLLLDTAARDGQQVGVGFGKDPGQAGKSQALHLMRAMRGFNVASAAESGDKLTRFGPFSSQCRAGNVKILRGLWNEDPFRVLEGFPDLAPLRGSGSRAGRRRHPRSEA